MSLNHRARQDLETCVSFPPPGLKIVVPDDVRTTRMFSVDISVHNMFWLVSKCSFAVVIPSDYPYSRPTVEVQPSLLEAFKEAHRKQLQDEKLNKCKDGQPKIAEDGSLGINILRDDDTGWLPSYTLHTLIFSLRDIFVLPGTFPEDKLLRSGEALMSKWRFRTFCGHAELQGRRPTMEDRIIAIPNLEVPGNECKLAEPIAFYAVLDGHGGDWAVQRAADLLPEKLVGNLSSGCEPTQALHQAFMEVDKIVVGEALKPKPDAKKKTDVDGFRFSALLEDAPVSVTEVSGTTCVCIIIDGRGRLYSANIGDSRAILLNQQKNRTIEKQEEAATEAQSKQQEQAAWMACGGLGQAPHVQQRKETCALGRRASTQHGIDDGLSILALTSDQKASMPEEIASIVAKGGFVANNRVMGQLAVARAFGDARFKTDKFDVLTAIPVIRQFVIDERAVMVLMACDGLFDVASSENAGKVAWKLATKNDFDLSSASKELATKAIEELFSKDNVSVMMILIERDERGAKATTGSGAAAKATEAEASVGAKTAAAESGESLDALVKEVDAVVGSPEISSGLAAMSAAMDKSASKSKAAATDGPASPSKQSDGDGLNDSELMAFMEDDTNFSASPSDVNGGDGGASTVAESSATDDNGASGESATATAAE